MDQSTSNTRAAIKQCLTVLYLVVWCYCLLSRSTTMLPVFKEQVQVAPWLLSQAQEQCNSMLSSAFPAVLLELPRGAVTLTISISELGLWAVCAPWGLHLWNPTQSGDPSTRYCENGKPVYVLYRSHNWSMSTLLHSHHRCTVPTDSHGCINLLWGPNTKK